ncbi:hypothetical protein C8J57DRAFT_1731840 [Mycena rebaudengoi]|nr:hypothetical protein C8J57DRAFT_1731840 [Mycena rebaudengoi]
MSSRSSTATLHDDDDDDLRAMLDAMAQSSPIQPGPATASKHRHGAVSGDDANDGTSDNENPGILPVVTNQNMAVAARTYGQRKRLRAEQLTELDVFLNDPALLRDAKLLANIFSVGNQVAQVVSSQPAYEVSSDLETNIQKYAPTVLLSSKINVYKGEVATNILLAIFKKYRFDIPLGLENNQADWAKIVVAVQAALTQRRSKIKKAINCSLKIHKTDTSYAPDVNHQNIFELTQAVVKGTQCTVNGVLCARVALMRSVYLKHPGLKFWDKLDEHLAKIRQEAKGDAVKLTKAFRHVLTHDQNTHGIKDYDLDEKAVDDFQQTVDDVIDVGVIDAATSAHTDASVE